MCPQPEKVTDSSSRLPTKDGLLDWDCAESIDIPDVERALLHIRSEGTFPVSKSSASSTHRSSHGVPSHASPPPPKGTRPASSSSCLPETPSSVLSQPFVDSKEDQNSVGQCPASEAKIAAMKDKVSAWLEPGKPGHDIFGAPASSPLRMCLLDGFLLYSPPEFSTVMSLIDIKLFLQVSRAKATQRREARDGYVTLEGFWKDPPGYVDKIVWPNYVEAHMWMFVDGDVEGGRLDWDVLREKEVLAQKTGEGLDLDFEETLEWTVDEVMRFLEGWYARQTGLK